MSNERFPRDVTSPSPTQMLGPEPISDKPPIKDATIPVLQSALAELSTARAELAKKDAEIAEVKSELQRCIACRETVEAANDKQDAEIERLKASNHEYFKALDTLASNQLNDDNCANVSLAGRRVSNVAREGLLRASEALEHAGKETK